LFGIIFYQDITSERHFEPNISIAKELKITPILDRLLEYKRNWINMYIECLVIDYLG
jgi:hypothetical protein